MRNAQKYLHISVALIDLLLSINVMMNIELMMSQLAKSVKRKKKLQTLLQKTF